MVYNDCQYLWDIPSIQGIGWTTFPAFSLLNALLPIYDISVLSGLSDKNHVGFINKQFPRLHLNLVSQNRQGFTKPRGAWQGLVVLWQAQSTGAQVWPPWTSCCHCVLRKISRYCLTLLHLVVPELSWLPFSHTSLRCKPSAKKTKTHSLKWIIERGDFLTFVWARDIFFCECIWSI